MTTALLEGLRTLPELEQQLRFAIEEGGRVADRAKSAAGACAGSCKASGRNGKAGCRN